MRVNKFVFSFIFFFPFFGGVHTTVFTKPVVTQDLDAQTFTGGCWKGNELQNTCASSEFRQMALQVRPERMSTGFGTTFVFSAQYENILKKLTENFEETLKAF